MTMATLNQGVHPEFVLNLAMRLADLVDWLHPGMKWYIYNNVIPDIRVYYSQAHITTAVLRHPNGKCINKRNVEVDVVNKDKDLRDIKPLKYTDPEGILFGTVHVHLQQHRQVLRRKFCGNNLADYR